MDAEKRLRGWEISLLAALCLSLCAMTWAGGQQRSISSSLVRLHVIAASDSEKEQQIKLRVRDAVLAYLAPKLEGAESSAQAQQIIRENIAGIESAAGTAAMGRAVRVSLGRESYPTREYGDYTLPAGVYDSLKVILGEGAGHNWWCVVFPPVCLPAAGDCDMQGAMSGGDYAIISEQPGYEVRFRLVELWGELLNRLEE